MWRILWAITSSSERQIVEARLSSKLDFVETTGSHFLPLLLWQYCYTTPILWELEEGHPSVNIGLHDWFNSTRETLRQFGNLWLTITFNTTEAWQLISLGGGYGKRRGKRAVFAWPWERKQKTISFHETCRLKHVWFPLNDTHPQNCNANPKIAMLDAQLASQRTCRNVWNTRHCKNQNIYKITRHE